jgi:hypothetical protein
LFILNEVEGLSTMRRTECASFDTESQDEVWHEVSLPFDRLRAVSKVEPSNGRTKGEHSKELEEQNE